MKNSDWHSWINEYSVWRESTLTYLYKIPERYRTLVALALSVAHWHPDNKDRGGSAFDCPLCKLFYKELPNVFAVIQECTDCPLVKLGQWCNDDESSWMQWNILARGRPPQKGKKRKTERKANEVYKHLLTAYAKEYNRVMV